MNGNESVHRSGVSPTVPRDLLIVATAQVVSASASPRILSLIVGELPSGWWLAYYAFHVALLILAFAAIASRASRADHSRRWRHLLHVALGAWIFSVVMTLTLNCALECILYEALILPLTMALGGALSDRFKPRLTPAPR